MSSASPSPALPVPKRSRAYFFRSLNSQVVLPATNSGPPVKPGDVGDCSPSSAQATMTIAAAIVASNRRFITCTLEMRNRGPDAAQRTNDSTPLVGIPQLTLGYQDPIPTCSALHILASKSTPPAAGRARLTCSASSWPPAATCTRCPNRGRLRRPPPDWTPTHGPKISPPRQTSVNVGSHREFRATVRESSSHIVVHERVAIRLTRSPPPLHRLSTTPASVSSDQPVPPLVIVQVPIPPCLILRQRG